MNSRGLITKNIKFIGQWFLLVFGLINLCIAFHAYNFTHFSTTNKPKTNSPHKLLWTQKLQLLLMGVSNPRPSNKKVPSQPYEKIVLQSDNQLSCWLLRKTQAKGTVILFHGYGGMKSSLLTHAAIFNDLGYSALIVDFAGSGESEGNQTTIGFNESMQVKTCYDYLKQQGETKIILFGTSMGAVAIMKAVSAYQLTPTKLILECPFGTLVETVKKRCANMQVPSFPFAYGLVFWGGVLNGFNGFAHNPSSYATQITVPTLLLYGEKDKNVTKQEIVTIFENLQGKKWLKTYANAGHENYLLNRRKW